MNPRQWMGFTISCVVLLAALYVLLSRGYKDGTEKWAFAMIGTILTWWLKPDSR
jgi:hypothetical protein